MSIFRQASPTHIQQFRFQNILSKKPDENREKKKNRASLAGSFFPSPII
jgi:hypothetical protein